MSQRCILPDPFRFAADGRQIEGERQLVALARLAEYAGPDNDTLKFAVRGGRGADGKLQLELAISGQLQLTCQRCLTPMAWPFELVSVLLLVRSGDEIPEDELEDDERDAIETTADLDVLALIEDEVLLALPVAPRHERCELPQHAAADEKKSPFAVLAGLKKQGGGER